MSLNALRERSLRSPRSVAAVALLLLVSATVLMWAIAERTAHQAVHTETLLFTDQLAARIRSCVNTRLEMVEAMGHEWSAGGLRESTSFAARAGSVIELFPGFLAINQVSPDGIITDVFPLAENQEALGKSLHTNPHASAALHEAQHTGDGRLTAPTNLFQGGTGYGFYFALQGGSGFLNGVFRAEELVDSCLAGNLADHTLKLTDGASPLYSREPHKPTDDEELGAERTFDVHDRQWLLRVRPSSQRVSTALLPPRLLLLVGLVLSCALSGLLYALLAAARKSRRQEQLQLSEIKNLAAVVDAANDFVGISDAEGRITYLNAAARRLTGLTKEDVASGKLSTVELMAPAQRVRAAEVRRQHLASDVRAVEFGLLNRLTGAITPMEFSTFWLPVGNGRELRATLARDLSASRKLEQELSQAQKMEALGRMAGGVAHDVNNILTVILSSATMLDSRPEEPTHRELVRAITAASDRAAKLTAQLLAFGRGRVDQTGPVDLSKVVAEMRPLLSRLLREDVQLDLTLDPRPAVVEGNTVQLEQIVLNLVLNAQDAMPQGGRLSVSVLGGSGEIELSVADQGIGMTPEITSRIFEPFFTTKEVGKGTGLGLATVYGHVQRMGARIAVESAPGKGTSFRIHFPERRGDQKAAAPAYAASPLPKPPTVLLVEDQEAVRAVVARMLRREGCRVIEASHGAEAIDLLAGGRNLPDIVISDVVMPKLGGGKLLQWVQENLPSLPVVLASAHTADALDSLPNGVMKNVRFLQKPFAQHALMEAITSSLAGAKSQPRS